MAVIGTVTNENGDAILISLQEPYSGVSGVLSYSDETVGETTSTFFQKSFRWGTDGLSYSDWIPLSDANLSALSLDANNPFWIQYKYEQIGEDTLEFKSISLETIISNGIIKRIPQFKCDSGTNLGAQNLLVDCCSSAWNPYDLSRAGHVYNQLSNVVSNIFGHCVKYFKTAADQRTRDVILNEYSLFNVIQTGEVKIMVPDNELPTREIQYNPLMMDFPVQFEIHIVKSTFQSVFGPEAKPEVKDYLYFERYLNKVYEVDAIAESDDFLYNGSYWRVSLVPYQQRTAVMYPDKNIEDEKDSIITSVELEFEKEADDEYKKTRKPNQYNTIGTLSNDYVRRILDKKLVIKEENVYNNWTIVSKYNYKLSSINYLSSAIEYKYNEGWSVNDDRCFSFWIRPTYNTTVGPNSVINSIINSAGKVVLESSNLPQHSEKLRVGDWINISGTNSYNGIHKILSINLNQITIDADYTDSILTNNPKFNRESGNTFMVYENSTSQYVSITQTVNWFILKLNDSYFKFNLKLSNVSFVKDNWYAILINLNHTSNQLSLFIYKIFVETNSIDRDGSLNLLYANTLNYNPLNIPNGHSWKILGGSLDITNIRIWSKPIEEELHELILSQYVVKDTDLSLLVDNASPQLMLQKIQNPR
jgi:hypothetical protein